MTSQHPLRKYRVSIKGVLLVEGKIHLLKNERDEWELPGGKLDEGEQPIECITREIQEELNIQAIPVGMLNSWLYKIFDDVEVLIITYACHSAARIDDVKYSHEHKELGLFDIDEIAGLNMPQGYKNSILLYKELFSKL